MQLLLFHGPGAAWVFCGALGTPGGSRTTKKEHPVAHFWRFWAQMGSMLGPLFFEIGPLGSKMAARRFNTGTFWNQSEAQGLKKWHLGRNSKRCRK